ncbi:MAG: hypothetical protein ABW321_31220 [Polyangiales bacterium]
MPALTFTPFITNWGHTEFIVSGEHDGNLQTQFSLRIYDEPPPEAMVTLTRGEPAIALGGITAVSVDHPSRLQYSRDELGNELVCNDTGECGVPRANACGTAAAPSCLGTLVPGKNWGNHGIADRDSVIYLAEPASAGSIYSLFFAQGQPIAAGYNLLHYEPVWDKLDSSAQLRYAECQKRAVDAALNRFNADHGTDYSDHTMIADGGRERDTKLLADWDGMMIASTVSEGCVLPGTPQIMPGTEPSQPLRLILNSYTDL